MDTREGSTNVDPVCVHREQEPGSGTELQEGRKQSQNFLGLVRSVDLDQHLQ